jgi:RNA polymerase sigma-54 factor
MSTNLSQTTSQRQVLQQRLILTQELQLFLKLIQMNTLELKDYLEEQLIENPTLEEPEVPEEKSESDSLDEEINFDNFTDNRLLKDRNDDLPHSASREFFDDSEEDTTWENRVSSADSLADHLSWQLKVSDFSDEERQIASIIIGNTNEDGYLETDISEIGREVLQEKGIAVKSDDAVDALNQDSGLTGLIHSVLCRIQSSFDPTGVCARDLKECLRVQALDMGYKETDTVIRLIDQYLEELEGKEILDIAFELGCKETQAEEAMMVISSLEPRPGRPFFNQDTEKYIVPDFYVYKVGNELQIQLNRDFPKVRISSYYRSLIKKQKTLPPETKQYIKEKLEAAQRIMKCLEEREAAVRKIITKIVEVQKDFFEHGRDYIKPLILKDVAQSVGVHESTVSRITSKRYMETPQGVIALKSLFSRKIETSHGKEISFEKVKSIIKDIVSSEMPESPYSDEDISKILERRSIKVARRTVAKYRKILKIPSSSARANEKRKLKNENNCNHKTYQQ